MNCPYESHGNPFLHILLLTLILAAAGISPKSSLKTRKRYVGKAHCISVESGWKADCVCKPPKNWPHNFFAIAFLGNNKRLVLCIAGSCVQYMAFRLVFLYTRLANGSSTQAYKNNLPRKNVVFSHKIPTKILRVFEHNLDYFLPTSHSASW